MLKYTAVLKYTEFLVYTHVKCRSCFKYDRFCLCYVPFKSPLIFATKRDIGSCLLYLMLSPFHCHCLVIAFIFFGKQRPRCAYKTCHPLWESQIILVHLCAKASSKSLKLEYIAHILFAIFLNLDLSLASIYNTKLMYKA